MCPFSIVKKRHFLSSKMALAKKPFEIDPYIVYFSESSYQGLALDIGFDHIHWVFSFHQNIVMIQTWNGDCHDSDMEQFKVSNKTAYFPPFSVTKS